jgi:hypothetical protein
LGRCRVRGARYTRFNDSSTTGLTTSPNPPVTGQQFSFTITGSNFDPLTAQVLISGPGCSPCTVPNGLLTSKSATTISGPVTLNTAGSYTLTVQNGSGTTASNGQPLTIGSATAKHDGADDQPEPAGDRTAVQLHHHAGSNFDPLTAQVLISGPGCSPCTVPNGLLTSKSATTLSGPVTLNTAGSYTLTVQNGSGTTASNGQPLTIGSATAEHDGADDQPEPAGDRTAVQLHHQRQQLRSGDGTGADQRTGLQSLHGGQRTADEQECHDDQRAGDAEHCGQLYADGAERQWHDGFKRAAADDRISDAVRHDGYVIVEHRRHAKPTVAAG